MASEVGALRVRVHSDSQLVVSQVNGKYQVKEPLLLKYLEIVKGLFHCFLATKIHHIPRERNARVDVLSKLASTRSSGNNKSVIQEVIPAPTVILVVEVDKYWYSNIQSYLADGSLPSDPGLVRQTQRQAARYCLIDGKLYRRGLAQPLMKCISGDTIDYAYDPQFNDQRLREELDLIEEIRQRASVREAIIKSQSTRRHDKAVVRRAYDDGDLVLRRADVGNKNAAQGKLAENWEGPYRIVSGTGTGAYRLETLPGEPIPRTWNADKLRRYYS
ncbi:Ribonuclease H-like superfamily [Sesbania bispinosa]|nr:Ribonuclease H-like superfamily [Sesbania bispinosa]